MKSLKYRLKKHEVTITCSVPMKCKSFSVATGKDFKINTSPTAEQSVPLEGFTTDTEKSVLHNEMGNTQLTKLSGTMAVGHHSTTALDLVRYLIVRDYH
ncbi:hypothetical protein JZ751_019645 [Albula glossodonta]|uniref:Uncharacterized protein n=1 Tax=Albula glossodonta TaxID=121402 RepID=A0A8T2NNL1_9TELE|nr:hypothetical protein JZ751_019645 [Albula glossodonta]